MIDSRKQMIFIPYAAIIFVKGAFNGTTFRFEFARGDQLWEAEIRGCVSLQNIVDKLTAGKWESIRTNGETVESIEWRQVVEPEDSNPHSRPSSIAVDGIGNRPWICPQSRQ